MATKKKSAAKKTAKRSEVHEHFYTKIGDALGEYKEAFGKKFDEKLHQASKFFADHLAKADKKKKKTASPKKAAAKKTAPKKAAAKKAAPKKAAAKKVAATKK
jgi:hypothetical protein